MRQIEGIARQLVSLGVLFFTEYLTSPNLETSVDVYNSSSALSDSSASSLSDSEVKRKRVINYLYGAGEEKWVPRTQLIHNEINITAALKKFRDRNVKEAKKMKYLSNLRILSLSFIFPLNKVEYEKSITSHMKEKVAESLWSLASKEVVIFPEISKEAIIYCFNEMNNIEQKYEPEDQLGKYVKQLVLECRDQRNAAINMNSEASFMNKFLMPILDCILINNGYENSIYSMIDGYDGDGKKPDFMFGVKDRKKEIYFFYVEVKRPRQQSK